MTPALSLRLKDEKEEPEKEEPEKGQVSSYPETRLPSDTPAASKNNSGYYLECRYSIPSSQKRDTTNKSDGIFCPANNYLLRGIPLGYHYVSRTFSITGSCDMK